ncbi:AsnC family protein [Mycetocola reblochoni]|uniref:Uncharacterized protein n=1 Tax=Mycetocola reblochoni REB411 TaxID=1255698 RepID=A0A1R4ILX6_9MICO|nr:hypothetical protein [Mycetocola reblochoni]SJN20837.1 hypothetical protein FM119_02465 [Mycetocola reblochoni REB411]
MSIRDRHDLNQLLTNGTNNTELAHQLGTSETTIRRIRNERGIPLEAPTTNAPTSAGESETHNPDGTSSYVRYSERPWGYNDYRDFIRTVGQDPDNVTFTWGWTSNPAGGFWNKLNNVRPANGHEVPAELIDWDALRKNIWNARQPTTAHREGTPVAAVLNLADMQLHKGDPAATIARIKNGVHKFLDHIEEQRAAGYGINEVVIVNNGAPFEGIAGNYANQPHTTHKGGLRAQMNAVLDIWAWTLNTVIPNFRDAQFVTVHCNHTQFGRQGGSKDAITGDSDTGGAFLAECLRREFRHIYPNINWVIPHDQMNVYTTAAGVNLGFNHGHKIPGSGAQAFEKWLGGQVRYDRDAYNTQVWVTAHKHHYAAWDMGSAFVYQAPSCDDGSKWLTDTTGQHARSGLLAYLVGNHDPMHTSHAVFL